MVIGKLEKNFQKVRCQPINEKKLWLYVSLVWAMCIGPFAPLLTLSDLKLLQNVVRDDDLGGDPGRDLILTFTLCSYLILLYNSFPVA